MSDERWVCGAAVAVSTSDNSIIIAYRGTTNLNQLLGEAIGALAGEDASIGGKVNMTTHNLDLSNFR